jgi:predicted Zn-dependent protease with MMP-like domain
MIDKVKIGPIEYTVIVEKDLHYFDDEDKRVPLYGHILSDLCQIKIESEIGESTARVTLVHEILHGIFFNADADEHDEHLIKVLSSGIVSVLRDNPALVEELTRP